MRKTLLFSALLFPFFCATAQITYTPLLVDSRYDASTPADVTAFMAPYKAKVDSMMSPVVGQVACDMDADRPESKLSNLLADVLVWAGKEFKEKPVMGLYNIGGIRASLSKGDVTVGDILDVAPFENKICFMTLKGSQLTTLFEQIAATGGEGVSHSVRAVITQDGKLVSLTINGKPVNPNADYRIATIDYLAEGNDGMKELKNGTERKMLTAQKNNLRYVIMDYFRDKAKHGEAVNSEVEGRISIAKADTDASKTIVILQSNDTHSQIYPFSKNLADKSKADKGGYIRRLALVEEQRKENPDLLLFDSGDFSQGSPYYTCFHGDVEVGLMNRMKYDAATIGNHEFDFGLDNMARIFRMAKFPIVCSNYDFTGTPVEGLVKSYIIIERSGKKIGVFGICPKLEGLVAKDNYSVPASTSSSTSSSTSVKYLDPNATAQKMATFLKKEKKCDLVICLSHLGWQLSGQPTDDLLVPATKDIDLVLGGHSHTLLNPAKEVKNLDSKLVPVAQNGKSGIYLSRFDIKLK